MAYSPCQLRRIEQGLCVGCAAPSDGKKHCKSCYERNREHLRVWRKQNPQKVRDYSSEWREKNAEQVKAAGRKRYAADPEKCKKHVRRWRAAHPTYNRERWRSLTPEQRRESVRKYCQRHRETVNARNRRAYRRAVQDPIRKIKLFARLARRTRGLVGSHTPEQWLARVSYYGWRCRWCHCELTPKTLTKDHVIAISMGGKDFASNLVPACKSCNSAKHTKRSYTPPS